MNPSQRCQPPTPLDSVIPWNHQSMHHVEVPKTLSQKHVLHKSALVDDVPIAVNGISTPSTLQLVPKNYEWPDCLRPTHTTLDSVETTKKERKTKSKSFTH